MQAFEYWRSKLSPDAQGCYGEILRAAKRQSQSVVLNTSVPPQEIAGLYDFLMRDYPDIYWLPHRVAASVSGPMLPGIFGMPQGGVKITLATPPIYSPKIQTAINASIFGALSGLSVLKGCSAYDSIVYVIKYLAENVRYEINNDFNQNAASALHFKKAQCSGISKAFKLMLDKLGIPCIVVTGTALANHADPSSAGPHSWNVVELDGVCYHVDPTALAGNYRGGELLDMYGFLYSDSEMKSHTWERSSAPACPSEFPAAAKRRADMRAGGFTSGSAAENGFIDTGVEEIASLFEIRALISKALSGKDECHVAFKINVDMDDDKLHAHVSRSVKQCLSAFAAQGPTAKVMRSGKIYNVIINLAKK